VSQHSAVSADLAQLEQALRETWEGDPDLASGPMRDLMEAGGKRIRPTLLLLCSRLGVHDLTRVQPAALAIELTHAATLVHDDVIDRSALRRGRPSVFASSGASDAILVGDYYFARAYREASRTGLAVVVETLAQSVMAICEGELEQQAFRFAYGPTIERYLRRCELKTGRLMSAACSIGADLGQMDRAGREACAAYGLELGIAFQIVDDVLDYQGDPLELGKPAGHDLLEGSATLPLILAREDPEVSRMLVDGQALDEVTVADVVRRVRDSGACERALEHARAHAERASEHIRKVAASPARAELEHVAAQMLGRKY